MPTILNTFLITSKDIYLKIINLSCIWAGLVSGSVILSFISDKTGPVPLFVFPVLMTSFLSLFYMEWLISNEKENGTFLWLRTLPVSDKTVVSSKVCTLALLLAIHPLAVLPSALINPVNLFVFLMTGLVAASLFCGCIWGMLIFLVLKGANKYIIPLFAIIIISLLALIIMREFDWLPGLVTTLPAGISAIWMIAPLTALLGWWLACRYFESRDSADLAD